MFYIHETLLVYKLEIFKNCKEVEHIMIMIIAIICIFYVGHPPLYVTFSIRLFIRCTAYLRNHTSSNHNFWYTYVKWWYLQVFISFFQNFDFLGCYVGKRAKNTPKWEITITFVMHHISGTVYHLTIIFGTCMSNDDISRGFFSFFFFNFDFLGC